MNIWIVKHLMDNGERYPEDYNHWETYKYYSSLDLAEHYYYIVIYGRYEGKYQLIEKTLDTQEEKLIEESPWVNCTPADYSEYDYSDSDYREFDGDVPEALPTYDNHPFDRKFVFDCWDDDDMQNALDEMQEEDMYLRTPHETYELFKQLEQDQLDDLNRLLKSLGID